MRKRGHRRGIEVVYGIKMKEQENRKPQGKRVT